MMEAEAMEMAETEVVGMMEAEAMEMAETEVVDTMEAEITDMATGVDGVLAEELFSGLISDWRSELLSLARLSPISRLNTL